MKQDEPKPPQVEEFGREAQQDCRQPLRHKLKGKLITDLYNVRYDHIQNDICNNQNTSRTLDPQSTRAPH